MYASVEATPFAVRSLLAPPEYAVASDDDRPAEVEP
jgi:hypothetical protein